METKSTADERSLGWLIVAAAGVRAAFGIVIAIDAYLKWQPGFAAYYVGYLQKFCLALCRVPIVRRLFLHFSPTSRFT